MKKIQLLLLLVSILHIGICNSQESDTKISQVEEMHKDSVQALVNTLVKSVWNHYTKKDYANTIKVGAEAIGLASQINDYKKITEMSSLMGNAFLQIEDTLEAKRIFSQSLEDAEKRKDSASMLATRIDLGNFYALQNEWEPAIMQYKKALPSAKKLNDTTYLFILNYNIAEGNLELKNLEEAEYYIGQVDQYKVNLKWPTYHASSALVHGKFSFLKNNPTEAIAHLKRSIEISEKENDIEGLIEAYEYYAKAEALSGNFKKAYELREKYDFYMNEKYKTDKIEAIETVTGKFKLNQFKQELKAAEQQNEFNKQQAKREISLVWSSIAAGILLLFSLFVLNSNRKRKKLLVDLTQKNKQYLKAKEKSEELTKAKTRMFSTISHELRTPMYGIIGISSLLQEDKSLKKHEENIKSLNFSADYLLSLINNVLLLNNLDSLDFKNLKEVPFNIRELVKNVIKSSEFIRTERPNTIEVNIDNNVPNYLMGDKVRLSQVLINLMSNALKFTENGIVQLEISKIGEEESKICLQFLVKDSGMGISPEKQQIIFNEFSHNNEGGEYKGTGLGLPIVKKILELHNSKLIMRSGVGQGTSMLFTICYEVPEKQTEQLEKTLLKEELYFKGKNILVVDDNKINQLVTQKSLQKLGVHSTSANSGKEAIDILQKEKFDLVLMDIHMPEMNGFQTTEAIRQFNTSIPIIALTAVEIEEIKESIISSGMNDFIIKPYDYSHFIETIYKQLSK